MATDDRTPLSEADIKNYAAALIRETSARHAAKVLGVSRETTLSLAGGFPVARGTLALVRERLRSLREAG